MSRKAPFEYWIAGLYKSGEVPVGLKLFIFPESDWALFSTKGPMSGSLQSLNTQARQGRYPTEWQKYMENGNAMLEVCSPSDMQSPNYECDIWVPVCKVEEKEYEAAEIVSTMMITGIL